jgi:hypothetical protein
VYLSMSVCLFKSKSTVAVNTFVQECVYLKRNTKPNEIIGLNSANPRRIQVVYQNSQD